MPTSIDTIAKVVAITYLGRSGSVFLQSLLDGHKEVLTTPGIALFSFYEFWESHKQHPPAQLVDSFISFYRVLFDSRTASDQWQRFHGDLGLTRLGHDRNEHIEVDALVFKKHLLHFIAENTDQLSRAWFFKAVHLSYKLCLTPTFVPTEQSTIVFPLHIPGPNRYAKSLTEDFPDAKFVTSVREPIQAFSSWVKHDRTIGATGLRTMLIGGYPISEHMRRRSVVVRIEDINADTEGTTRELCSWLGLTWQNSMLMSTFNGKSWWGDTPASPPKSEPPLSVTDSKRLAVLLFPLRHQWGYTSERAPSGLLHLLIIFSVLVYPFTVEPMGALELRRLSLNKPRRRPLDLIKYMIALSGVRQTLEIIKARPGLFFAAANHRKARPTMTIKQLSACASV